MLWELHRLPCPGWWGRKSKQPCRDCQKAQILPLSCKDIQCALLWDVLPAFTHLFRQFGPFNGWQLSKEVTTHWPVFALLAVHIPCPELHVALGLWKPFNISTAVHGSLRQQKKCWKTSQLCLLIVFPPFCAHQLPGMIQSVYGFLEQSLSWLQHPPENTPQYSTSIYQFAAPRVDWANSFPVLASFHLQSKVKEKDKIFP